MFTHCEQHNCLYVRCRGMHEEIHAEHVAEMQRQLAIVRAAIDLYDGSTPMGELCAREARILDELTEKNTTP